MIEPMSKFFLWAYLQRLFYIIAVTMALGFHIAVDPGHAVSNVPASQCSGSGEDSDTTIRLLGTAGGPINRQSRSQPASLLSVGQMHYLIDAGDGVSGQLVKAGIPLPRIKQIFLTHLHGDHVVGLAPLMMFDWAAQLKRPVGIYGPPGTKKLVWDGIEYISTPVEIFRSQYPPVPQLAELFSAIEPDVADGSVPTHIYSDDYVKVSAIANSHYATMPTMARVYGRDRSYSYRFETGDRSVVFTGDTGPSEALAALAEDVDILVTEVIDIDGAIALVRKMSNLPDDKIQEQIDHMREEHLSPAEVGKLASQARVKSVILTHIVPGEGSDASAYVNEIRKYYTGPIHFGDDLSCH